MHPSGCFSSSLAYAPETAVCQKCDMRAECGAAVEARRPTVLRLLSRFTDSRGEQMTVHWLTPEERKKLKAIRKQRALEEAEEATYGLATALNLKSQLDKRARPIFEKMTLARINVQHHTGEVVGTYSKQMAALVKMLSSRPHTMQELTTGLASECDLSASTAQRDAYALVSILNVCDRLSKSGSSMELK